MFGTAAGYAIKKVMKIAAVVIGLFVAALAYLSYKGLIDVKWYSNTIRSASIYCLGIRPTNSSCGWICSWPVNGVQKGIKND